MVRLDRAPPASRAERHDGGHPRLDGGRDERGPAAEADADHTDGAGLRVAVLRRRSHQEGHVAEAVDAHLVAVGGHVDGCVAGHHRVDLPRGEAEVVGRHHDVAVAGEVGAQVRGLTAMARVAMREEDELARKGCRCGVADCLLWDERRVVRVHVFGDPDRRVRVLL